MTSPKKLIGFCCEVISTKSYRYEHKNLKYLLNFSCQHRLSTAVDNHIN